MDVKLFEIRDCGTFIPVMAFVMHSDHEAEHYLLRRSGWGTDGGPFVCVQKLDGKCELRKTPEEWSRHSRTMPVAHTHIAANWSRLTTGDVVCVETILGERDKPKTSERFDQRYEEQETPQAEAPTPQATRQHLGGGIYASFDGYRLSLYDSGQPQIRITLAPAQFDLLRNFSRGLLSVGEESPQPEGGHRV